MATQRARLLNSSVVTFRESIIGMRPGAERYRFDQRTACSNLFRAGDHIRSGQPPNMEGAVISGRRAALALLGQR